MNEQEWFNAIAPYCEKSKPCRGGAMCYYYDKKNYCDFDNCPRIKDV